mgnify:CR=1 FL=1
MMTWEEIKKLRSAYNHGYRTDETRLAAKLYIAEMRKRKKESN